MSEMIDVVVVGAGPVGLLTAIELMLRGIRVVLLERLAAPSLTIKALGVGPLGGEALQRRGLSAALAAAEERGFVAMGQAGVEMRARAANHRGHFGGLFIRREPQAEPERQMRMVDQQGLEAILDERARALGVDLRRDCEVTGFAQRPDGVDVAWTSPAGAERIACRYLVGCDGGRSTIRKMAGFAFPGTPPTMTMYQAVVDIDRPDRLLPIGWHRTAEGVFAYGPFPRRLLMLDFSGPPADRLAPVLPDEIESVLRRLSGADVRVTGLDVANRWTDNTRLVDSYRHGRVFLAGDAAHIHSPFGGQGLSLGLVDAANLGWKLAAVLRDGLPDSLLDTYSAERRPVAEAVLANTLAQAAIMRPDPQSGAMRDVLAALMRSDEVTRIVGGMMSGLASRYDLGPAPEPVGRLLGDRRVHHDGAESALYDLMGDGGGILLDASRDRAASRTAASLAPHLRCATMPDGPTLLVRPDGCVAWAAEREDMEGLEAALRRWFVPQEAVATEPPADGLTAAAA